MTLTADHADAAAKTTEKKTQEADPHLMRASYFNDLLGHDALQTGVVAAFTHTVLRAFSDEYTERTLSTRFVQNSELDAICGEKTILPNENVNNFREEGRAYAIIVSRQNAARFVTTVEIGVNREKRFGEAVYIDGSPFLRLSVTENLANGNVSVQILSRTPFDPNAFLAVIDPKHIMAGVKLAGQMLGKIKAGQEMTPHIAARWMKKASLLTPEAAKPPIPKKLTPGGSHGTI